MQLFNSVPILTNNTGLELLNMFQNQMDEISQRFEAQPETRLSEHEQSTQMLREELSEVKSVANEATLLHQRSSETVCELRSAMQTVENKTSKLVERERIVLPIALAIRERFFIFALNRLNEDTFV